MLAVHFPTTDGRTLILSRYTQPEADQKILRTVSSIWWTSSNSVSNCLRSLLPKLPQKAPSIIDSTAPNVVKTF